MCAPPTTSTRIWLASADLVLSRRSERKNARAKLRQSERCVRCRQWVLIAGRSRQPIVPPTPAGCSPFSYVETSAARGINTQQKQEASASGRAEVCYMLSVVARILFPPPLLVPSELFYREPFLLERDSVNTRYAAVCCYLLKHCGFQLNWLHYHESS